MHGLVDLARSYLRLPANIWIPENVEWVSGTSIADPIYSASIGVLLLVGKYGSIKQSLKVQFSLGGITASLRHLFKKIMP
jgi:Co/Zn/Cd efflux system component